MRTKKLIMLLCVAALTGCFRENYSEDAAKLAVPDTETLSIQAEVLGDGDVFDADVPMQVAVRANRSWSAVIVYEGKETDWLTLSSNESLNLQRYTVCDTILARASRNTTTESRKAKIVFSSDADTVTELPVVQKGQTRFLRVSADRDKALAIQDTIVLKVACNTAWTAVVEGASTAAATLETDGGIDYSDLKVCFDENNDATEEKEALVTVTAGGCDPVSVRIPQVKGNPYVAFRMSQTEIPIEDDSCVLHFASNTDWHLEVVETDHFTGCKFSQNAGGPTTTGDVTFSFDHGREPGILKSVTLKLSADGVEPSTVTLTQKGCLHLDFLDLDAEKWNSADHPKWWFTPKWPFVTPAYSEIGKGSAASAKDQILECTTAEGYVFRLKSSGSTGTWFHEHQMGFIVGTNKLTTYVEFPAIEGKKLKTIIYEPPYTGSANTYDIRDIDGAVVDGTATLYNYELGTETSSKTTQIKTNGCSGANKVTMEKSICVVFELSDPLPGAAYRQTLVYAGTINIKDYILIYE